MNTQPHLLRPLGLALTALALLAACGDDPAGNQIVDDPDTGSPDTTPDTTPEPDVETDVPDAEPDVEPDIEEPPVPAAITLSISPTRAVYPVGFRVNPVAVVTDEAGEIIADAELTWTVTPDGGLSPEGTGYLTVSEGDVTLEVCTVAVPELCADATILVDAGPPTIELLRPQPGDHLSPLDGEAIEVEAIVTDTHGNPTAFVNGQAVELDAGGRFIAEVTPRFGINHLEIVASDGINPLTSTETLDVMWAPEYLPTGAVLDPEGLTEKGVAVSILDAVQVRLNQNFVDNGVLLGPPDEAGVRLASDLADIFQLVLTEIDLLSALPNPVVASDTLTLAVDSIDLGGARVYVDITNSGLEIFIDFEEVLITTRGFLAFGGENLDLTGTLNVSLAALVVLDLTKPSREEELQVDVTDVRLALESVEANFASPEANAVFELAESLLFGTIEDVLIDTLAGSFIDQIPVLITDLLGSLDTLLTGAPIVLDTGILPTVSIALQGEIATITAAERSNLTIALDLSLATDLGPEFPDAPGVAISVPDATLPGFFSSSRLQLGAKQSLVNGLLFALWDSGVLNADVSSVLPESLAVLVSSVALDARLPPILTSATADESDLPFLISVGQMQITLGNGSQLDTLGATLRIGADIQFADSRITIVIDEVPQLELWLISTTGAEPIFSSPDDLKSIIVDTLWPTLTEGLLGGLGFDIPAIGGDIFAGISPALAALQLNIVLDRPVALRNGYVIIDAGIDALLPPATEGSGAGEGSGGEGSGAEGSGAGEGSAP